MSSISRADLLFRLFRRLASLEESFYATAALPAAEPGEQRLGRARGELLRQIQAGGGRLQVQDIAERTGRTKSTAAELAAKLCRDGYVFKMRVAGDGRGVWVVLSGKGRRAAARYRRTMADLNRSTGGILTDAVLARLETLALQIEKSIMKGVRP